MPSTPMYNSEDRLLEKSELGVWATDKEPGKHSIINVSQFSDEEDSYGS